MAEKVRLRFCSRGDTVSTVKPLSQYDILNAGKNLDVVVETAEACAYANHLILKGTWRVSICGQCRSAVEACSCEEGGFGFGQEEASQEG